MRTCSSARVSDVQLSTISRCDYRQTCALLIPLFDEAAQRYEELLSVGQTSGMNLAIQEGGYLI